MISDVPEIPYFEGDFWPNIMEDCIKELEQEELEEKRRREEEEAAADTMIDLESSSGDSIEVCWGLTVVCSRYNNSQCKLSM